MQRIDLRAALRTAAFVFLLLGALPLVHGVPSSPTTIDVLSSERRDLGLIPDQNISAQAGNITELDITVLSVSRSWQGYYGNITGYIVLDDADNNSFYNWTLTTITGEIYAARNASVSFTTVNCTNATQITAEETFLGHAAIDGDSVTNTFNATNHPLIYVGTKTIANNSCPSTNAFGPSGLSPTEFYQVLLSDGAESIVYTAILENSQAGFDGNAYDFELLVGENNHDGSPATTTYYLWVELGI